MQFSTIVAGLVAAAGVSAREITVNLGAPPMKDVYSPDTVTAGPGDSIRFHWVNGMHYVAQSDFNTPCAQKPNGWGSPIQRNTSAVDWILRINSTETQIAYCGIADHCQLGMALIINPQSGANAPTLASYQAAAKNTKSQPAVARGGLLANQTGAFPVGASASPRGSAAPTSAAPRPTQSAAYSNEGSLLSAGAGAVAAGFAAFAYVL